MNGVQDCPQVTLFVLARCLMLFMFYYFSYLFHILSFLCCYSSILTWTITNLRFLVAITNAIQNIDICRLFYSSNVEKSEIPDSMEFQIALLSMIDR